MNGKIAGKRKFYLMVALALALAVSGGVYTYTWTTATGTINITEPTGDIATVEKAANQPDWDSVLPPGPRQGEVPTGDLFVITPHADYAGDLVVKVYLTNVGALIKAYEYLNMKLYLEGSVEAGETPDYQLLTLENGVATFNLQDCTGGAHILSVIGGSYRRVSGPTSGWEEGWSITPEFYCEATQR